jgi:16S rRNA (cytosine967-C5)-methyltransferase
LLQDAVAIAVEALSWMELEGLSERQALARASRQLGLHDDGSLRLAFNFITETIRRLSFIDMIETQALSPRKMDEWSLGVKNFLRIYTYWIHFRNATFKETLSLLNSGRKVLGRGELFPVEEAFGRSLGIDPKQLLINEPEQIRTSHETGHPEWFVNYCYKLLGRGDALRLLDEDRRAPPTYLRINRVKHNSDEAVRTLENEGVSLIEIENFEDLWRVERTVRPLVKLKSYRNGFFQIQDLSSQAACIAASPKPGDFVLDVCAAPGVKTCSLAQMMENTGTILSIDISTTRMKVWKGEVRRMGVEAAHPTICDARQSLPIEGEADLVFLDPPCSSTGIFSKLPSMKWRINPEDVARLSSAQSHMLEVSSSHVKRLGALLYSTCSILVEENELVVEKFLRTHPDFEIAPASLRTGSSGLRGLTEAIRFYPHKDRCNGFFLARMNRLD